MQFICPTEKFALWSTRSTQFYITVRAVWTLDWMQFKTEIVKSKGIHLRVVHRSSNSQYFFSTSGSVDIILVFPLFSLIVFHFDLLSELFKITTIRKIIWLGSWNWACWYWLLLSVQDNRIKCRRKMHWKYPIYIVYRFSEVDNIGNWNEKRVSPK